jgi:hypothetical protein
MVKLLFYDPSPRLRKRRTIHLESVFINKTTQWRESTAFAGGDIPPRAIDIGDLMMAIAVGARRALL